MILKQLKKNLQHKFNNQRNYCVDQSGSKYSFCSFVEMRIYVVSEQRDI
jgi:hypothetical protein